MWQRMVQQGLNNNYVYVICGLRNKPFFAEEFLEMKEEASGHHIRKRFLFLLILELICRYTLPCIYF